MWCTIAITLFSLLSVVHTQPAAFDLTSPGAITDPVGTTIATFNPDFTWPEPTSTTGTVSYTFCLEVVAGATDPCVTYNTITPTLSGTSMTYSAGLLTQTSLYAWGVKITDDLGTTDCNGVFYFISPTLAGATITAPASAATGQSTTPDLTWNTPDLGAFQDYCVKSGTPCATGDYVAAGFVTATTDYTVTSSALAPGATYNFAVRTCDIGRTSCQEVTSTFHVPPAIFDISTPLNNAYGVVVTGGEVTLTWGASTGATKYDVCLQTTDCAGSNFVATFTDVPATATTVTYNAAATTHTQYFWSVQAKDDDLGTDPRQSTTAERSFYTGPPAPFDKSSPISLTPEQTITSGVTLAWDASAGQTSYSYCYDTKTTGACTGWTTLTGATVTIPATSLAYGTTYRWNVYAFDGTAYTWANGAEGDNTPSSFATFTTVGTFTKSNPAPSATGVEVDLTLQWSAAATATSYSYCYDTVIDSACTDWHSTTSTSADVTLQPGTQYEWQVRAVLPDGTSLADTPGTFQTFTTAAIPGAFSKKSPRNPSYKVALDGSSQTTLTWGTSSNADTYTVCVDKVIDGKCTDSTYPGLTATSKAVTLESATIYEWQVTAVGTGGNTLANSGTVYSFKTLPVENTNCEI